jgi:hypothetical protein
MFESPRGGDLGPINLLLQLTDETTRTSHGGKFKYEAMWDTHKEMKATVMAGWNGGLMQSVFHVQGRLTSLIDNLGIWSNEMFGSVRKEIRKLNMELETLRNIAVRAGLSHVKI